MTYEELSFFNHQLAGMLKSGLPLEGSLREIVATMRKGELRDEIEQLERDLAQGTSLDEAIGRRRFPELYAAMVRVGLKTGDLPAVLTMLADFYRTVDTTWTRLKGLLVYPGIVLFTSVVVAGLLALLTTHITTDASSALGGMLPPGRGNGFLLFRVWLPVLVLGLIALVFIVLVGVRSIRHRMRWRVPGFREASLAQLASAAAMMLEKGCDAGSTFQLLAASEQGRARVELMKWRERLSAGTTRFLDVAKGRLVPPLFVWLVASAGENWAAGFRRAAEVYGARAAYRIELALYAALPISILVVAAIVATEVMPIMSTVGQFMNWLGDMGGVD
jgi:type II secretory pathway component PulF